MEGQARSRAQQRRVHGKHRQRRERDRAAMRKRQRGLDVGPSDPAIGVRQRVEHRAEQLVRDDERERKPASQLARARRRRVQRSRGERGEASAPRQRMTSRTIDGGAACRWPGPPGSPDSSGRPASLATPRIQPVVIASAMHAEVSGRQRARRGHGDDERHRFADDVRARLVGDQRRARSNGAALRIPKDLSRMVTGARRIARASGRSFCPLERDAPLVPSPTSVPAATSVPNLRPRVTSVPTSVPADLRPRRRRFRIDLRPRSWQFSCSPRA